MEEHKQVCVKVNAYVDEKIAPVVGAMSKFQNIVTEYSCEDNRSDMEMKSDLSIPRAYIIFHAKCKYGNWQELGKIWGIIYIIAQMQYNQLYYKSYTNQRNILLDCVSLCMTWYNGPKI